MGDAPQHLSKSQCNELFGRWGCALRYKRKRIDHEKGRPLPAKVSAGTALHKGFARYFLAVKQNVTPPSQAQLTDIVLSIFANTTIDFGATWEAPPNDEPGLLKDLALAVGEFMRFAPELKPWAIEHPAPALIRYADVDQPIDNYIDLVLDNEQHTIIDWKFAQRFEATTEPDAEQVLYSLWHFSTFTEVVNTPFERIVFCRYKDRVEVKRDRFVVTADDRKFWVENVIYPALRMKQAGIYIAQTGGCARCEFSGIGVCASRGQI